MTSSLYIPTADELDHVAEQMTVKYTGDRKRIIRAAQLIAAGAVEYTENVGWSVASQRDERKQDPDSPEPWRYTVTTTSCGCADHLFRASAIGRCGDTEVMVLAACKHILSVQMYLRLISAKLDAAIKAPFGSVYAIETRTDNVHAVFDRESDEVICGAQYLTRTDAYRPETGKDAAAFARWQAAQPVAVDFSPGGLLQRILKTAPGATLALRADVVYGSPNQYTFCGYRMDGATWVHLEHAGRQQFNETAWLNLLQDSGWIMPGRPVKQPGIAYHYLLERGDATVEHFGLNAPSADELERRQQNRQFSAFLVGGSN